MTKTAGGLALAKKLCGALADKKAEDIRLLDVGELSTITDYLVVATATSEPHLRALRVELERVLDEEKAHIVGIESPTGSGWIVVDSFDVMAHLFLPEMRSKYRLENLWKDASEIQSGKLAAVKRLPKKRARKKPVKKTTKSARKKRR